MSFKQIFSANKKVLSFEFFPPKQEEDLGSTYETIRELAGLQPDFMNVTYGAGGGTRLLTNKMVAYINKNFHIPAAAHLTCVNHTIAEINERLDALHANGISHVLALRGDPPAGTEKFVPIDGGFSCARDLVKHIKKRNDFSIAVAGYPEIHPEAASANADIAYLKEKVDAGAELIITQLFFDADAFFKFLDLTQKADINVPITAGIMPVTGLKHAMRITSRCKAKIPQALISALEKYSDDPLAELDYCSEYTLKLCQKLLANGAAGVHFYTLNKAIQVKSVVKALFNK